MSQVLLPSAAGTAFSGLSHLSFRVKFWGATEPALERIDQWLAQAFEIQVEPVAAPSPPLSAESERVAQFLGRGLLVARMLLQVGNVPVFDAPVIRSLAPATQPPGHWDADVEFAEVCLIPQSIYTLAIEVALKLCRWAATAAITDDNRKALYATLEQKFQRPMGRLVPEGKSTIPVLRVAHRLNIPFIHLGHGVYQLGWGSKARRMDRSTTELDSAMGSKLAHNKVAAANLLRAAGLPAPVHWVASNLEEALAAARQLSWPVVVKPSDRERGEGVAVDIDNEAALKSAFEAAQGLSRSRQVIVERQVPGVCHRLFMAAGKLLYAVKRLPIGVTADGSRSVVELIDSEVAAQSRKPPWQRCGIRPLDQLAQAAIRAAGWQAASVPPAGTLVPLRRIESTEWGGIDEEVTHRIHPENLRIAKSAATLFGLHMAGIDIITPDIQLPWHENGAIINEVNFAPLLGGGEISRRHIPIFLRDFLGGDGRIPVEVFEGGESGQRAALERHRELIGQGLRCYFTSDTRTLDENGRERILPLADWRRRTTALLLCAEVDAIVVLGAER